MRAMSRDEVERRIKAFDHSNRDDRGVVFGVPVALIGIDDGKARGFKYGL